MHEAPQLVHITRGAIVESVHRGHIAVVDVSGRVTAKAGDPAYVTYARSSAKLLQAVPVVASGAAEAFKFSPQEIAILCASHSGEALHVETVTAMLAKIGIDQGALQCGAHAPYHKPSADELRREGRQPTPLHNNCSGKHSGMLALSIHLGAPLDTYMEPDHPAQRQMLETFAAFAGVSADDIAIGIDGCGVPVYGLPLKNLAQAFAGLGSPSEHLSAAACRQITDSIARHPNMLAGTGRYDTALIEATGGRLIGKMGAEGVFAVSNPGSGLGLAVKIEDGSQRALYPAATEALKQLGWLSLEETEKLARFHEPAVRNWSGTEVGRTTSVFRLEML
ncbi:asparaginase [Paenibacillus alkalitolerans]|uniref:asparaginase n=1 Tax=Paenibacillus alkalitolerans TaxID=2799335 RepID=UPI0018F6193B|nr:asparaginase [Paenibacillus alkalitolerans]